MTDALPKTAKGSIVDFVNMDVAVESTGKPSGDSCSGHSRITIEGLEQPSFEVRFKDGKLVIDMYGESEHAALFGALRFAVTQLQGFTGVRRLSVDPDIEQG